MNTELIIKIYELRLKEIKENIINNDVNKETLIKNLLSTQKLKNYLRKHNINNKKLFDELNEISSLLLIYIQDKNNE